MCPYIDSHLHLGALRLGKSGGQAPEAALLCGITPDDWAEVLATAGSSHGTLTSAIGVHPWHVHEFPLERTIRKLEELLTENPGAIVGEVGLDGCQKRRETLDAQKTWLKRQLNAAQRLGRPAILHLVRCVNDALPILEDFKEVRTLAHGFHGTPQETRQLLKLPKIFFSLGFDAECPGKNFLKTLKCIPQDRLLVDSDAPFRGHDTTEIPRLVNRLAELREEDPRELEAAIQRNFKRFLQVEESP